MKTFKQFCESYIDPNIRKYLERRGYKYLGKGVDQMAFLEPGTGYVLKVFGTSHDETNGNFTEEHHMFKVWVEYCERNKSNPMIPKIFGWEAFEYNDQKHLQIRMEKLSPLDAKLGDGISEMAYYSNINSNPEAREKFYQDMMNQTHKHKNVSDLVTKVGKDRLELYWKTLRDLSKLRQQYNFGWDTKPDNFMKRSNGDIVLVDPFAL